MTSASIGSVSADHERRLRRWVNVVVLIGLLELPYLAWPWISPLLQPERYSNHHDQIAAALRRHGVNFTEVYLNQGWPDRINNQTFGANLTIYVSGSTPVIGRMECRVQKRNCWFQVAKLNIEREELPDLISVTTEKKRPSIWKTLLHDILAELGLHL